MEKASPRGKIIPPNGSALYLRVARAGRAAEAVQRPLFTGKFTHKTCGSGLQLDGQSIPDYEVEIRSGVKRRRATGVPCSLSPRSGLLSTIELIVPGLRAPLRFSNLRGGHLRDDLILDASIHGLTASGSFIIGSGEHRADGKVTVDLLLPNMFMRTMKWSPMQTVQITTVETIDGDKVNAPPKPEQFAEKR